MSYIVEKVTLDNGIVYVGSWADKGIATSYAKRIKENDDNIIKTMIWSARGQAWRNERLRRAMAELKVATDKILNIVGDADAKNR
jgi:hypothetical protein